MPPRQFAVGDGNDLIGVIQQLMQGHFVVRPQNFTQKVYQ